jgi:Txe/YoeB family toxin of Txe-Axe toxin-antitoxin module
MRYIFADESWEDYLYWQKTNKKYAKKINNLFLVHDKNYKQLNIR